MGLHHGPDRFLGLREVVLPGRLGLGELSREPLGSAFSAVPLRLLRPGGAHLQSQQSVRVSSAISSYPFLDSLAADCGKKPVHFTPHTADV